MADLSDTFRGWVSTGPDRYEHFDGYMNAIAQARYVIRRVLRIADEEARRRGIDPLAHQMLIQVCAANGQAPTISAVAERLDVAPAFASRLIRALEGKGLVTREPSPDDRRSKWVAVTPQGVELLRDIDSAVHVHIDYLQKTLADDARYAALATFAFYLGIELRPDRLSATAGDSSIKRRR